MTWNQASLKWRTYRSPKPRVTHAPVGPKGLIETGDLTTWLQAERSRTGLDLNKVDLNSHKCCGVQLCVCKPVAQAQDVSDKLDWYQARDALVAGKTVQRLHSGEIWMRLGHEDFQRTLADGTRERSDSFAYDVPLAEFCITMWRVVDAFTGDLDWHQAKAAMVAGHVVSTVETDCVGRWRRCEGAFRCRMQSDQGRFVWPISNMFNRPEPREFHKDNRYRVVDGEP